jgi:predicted acyltransferase
MNNHSGSGAKSKSSRLWSLDALRGFDMFWIVSGEGIFHGIANGIMTKYQLNRNTDNWQIGITDQLNFFERLAVGISNQLHHSVWDGFTFYDLIFPLFIFIAGVSMPYSFGRQIEMANANAVLARKSIFRSLVRRTILLILLGMVVNGALQFQGYENTRFASVLGRIAVSCFLGAVIFLNFSLRAQIYWFAGLLLTYWAAMMLIPVPGFGAGNLSPEGNLAAYIDRALLPGKLHGNVFDPEGLLTNIPAAGTALLGIFSGQFLRNELPGWSMPKKCLAMATSGLFLLATGWLWGMLFPVNKALWTSSFVLVTGGWSLLLLAAFYGVTDILQFKKWSLPFVWIGMNSILIYIAAHGAVNFEATAQFVFGGIISRIPGIWQEAFTWIAIALLQFSGLYVLFKNKLFLKV